MSATSGTSANGPSRGDEVAYRSAVVAGHDGTPLGRVVVQRAAQEALALGASLLVLHLVPTGAAGTTNGSADPPEPVSADIRRVRAAFPSVDVGRAVVPEDELGVMEAELTSAQLLVLGDAGSVGPRVFLLGETARALARRTRCPLLVVPGVPSRQVPQEPALHSGASEVAGTSGEGSDVAGWDITESPAGDATAVIGAVLVGVGRGPAVVGLLRVAGEHALRHATRLCVLHAHDGGAGGGATSLADVRRQVQHSLGTAALHPAVRVTTILTTEPPAAGLLRLATVADLLVIGSRGPLAQARLTLRSTSRAVLDQATHPVLVVPHDVAEAVPRRRLPPGA